MFGKISLRVGGLLCALWIFHGESIAAPPAVTSLFPAGAGRGQSCEITAAGTFDSWPVQVWVSGSGVDIAPSKAKGKFAVKVAADAALGPRWLRFHTADGASALQPFVIGALPELIEIEPNDDPKKAQHLTSAMATINGKLSPAGDVDHFSVHLKKNETLVASILANQVLKSPMDGHLQIVSPDGYVFAENNDCHGLDPQLEFTPPKDGVYLVRVFAFPASPDSSIHLAGGDAFIYRLTLTTGPFVDHPFLLAVNAADPGEIELIGWNFPAKDRHLPYASALSRLDRDWIRRERHACLVEREPNDRKSPQMIPLPVTISGHIDPPGDLDAFEFTARKGMRLQIQAEAQRIGSPLDPVLTITDSAGKMIAELDDSPKSADPEIAFSAPGDGKYRIIVSDRYRHGGWRYFYRLRVVPPEPDFSLSVAADRFTLVPGKPLDIPVTIERTNGHTEPIVLAVHDLPAGVTAALVGGDKPLAATVKSATIRLTAAKGPVSKPFRISATSISWLTGNQHFAHPTVVEDSVDYLWLTVPSKSTPPKK